LAGIFLFNGIMDKLYCSILLLQSKLITMRYLVFIIGLLITLNSFAKIPKPKKNTYVNDFAGVLTKAEVKALNVDIHRIERLSGVQMALVLVNTLPQEYEIEDFALLIARKWRIGKHKNGLVYVAALKQRKQRLEVAQNLVDKFTDEKSAEILNLAKPYFREQDYNGGLQAMVREISGELIKPEPSLAVAGSSVEQESSASAETTSDINQKEFKDYTTTDWLHTLYGSLIIGGIIWLIVRLFRRRKYKSVPQQVYEDEDYLDEDVPVRGNYRGSRYSSGYGRPSGGGSALGGFVAGAATGYAARAIQDHLEDDREKDRKHDEEREREQRREEERERERRRNEAEERRVSDNDEDETDYGSWSSGSDSGSSSGSSSSSNGGFNGSGATSDW
jgi:uncharacterized protein